MAYTIQGAYFGRFRNVTEADLDVTGILIPAILPEVINESICTRTNFVVLGDPFRKQRKTLLIVLVTENGSKIFLYFDEDTIGSRWINIKICYPMAFI